MPEDVVASPTTESVAIVSNAVLEDASLEVDGNDCCAHVAENLELEEPVASPRTGLDPEDVADGAATKLEAFMERRRLDAFVDSACCSDAIDLRADLLSGTPNLSVDETVDVVATDLASRLFSTTRLLPRFVDAPWAQST